jgi:hypothetical protein
MNYSKHYDLLIDRAKPRVFDGYTERHHIIPKCLGGNGKKDNIVRLTPEEHFVAHQLLVKMYPDNRYLILAVKMMTVSGGKVIRNNKMFGWLRKKFSEAMKSQVVSDETRKKMSDNARKRKFSEETRKKMSDSRKGKILKKGYKHTAEAKQKISESGKRACKEETKAKISLANSGRKLPPVSETTRKKLSEANTGFIHKKVICPHCNKEGGITGMKAWHFEKCKEKNV